ncbi:hypothetical protein CR513_18990, partial [Mucuna pruriens]
MGALFYYLLLVLIFIAFDGLIAAYGTGGRTMVEEKKGKIHNEVEKENWFIEKKYIKGEKSLSIPIVNALEDDNDSKEIIDSIPIALRKCKRSYARYSISQFVYIDHLSPASKLYCNY